MSKKEIRLGVVGVRNIGKNHIRHACTLEGVKVVAVADTDPERIALVEEEFGAMQTFGDAADLFACDDVDAVVLPLPNHLHAPMAIAAMEAGKHVLVEKPIAHTVAAADTMIAARDASGKTLMVGMNQRFKSTNVSLKNAIAAGAIGRVQMGRTAWIQRDLNVKFWERGDWAMSMENSGGGPVSDLGIHRLDLALYFLGFPKVASVTGQCYYGIGKKVGAAGGRDYQIEDGGVGLITFTNGTSLVLEASYFQMSPVVGQYTRLYGEKGSIDTSLEDQLYCFTDGELRPAPLEPDTNSAKSCVEHFVRVLRGEEDLIPTPEQAREGLRIIEAFYASAASGKTVYFD